MIRTGRQLVSNRSWLSHAPVIVFLQLILICLYNSSRYYALTISSCRYRQREYKYIISSYHPIIDIYIHLFDIICFQIFEVEVCAVQGGKVSSVSKINSILMFVFRSEAVFFNTSLSKFYSRKVL